MLCVVNNEMEGSVFAPALEGIKLVKSEQGEILTQPFLDACKHILPVIGTCSCSPSNVIVSRRSKEDKYAKWAFFRVFFLLFTVFCWRTGTSNILQYVKPCEENNNITFDRY